MFFVYRIYMYSNKWLNLQATRQHEWEIAVHKQPTAWVTNFTTRSKEQRIILSIYQTNWMDKLRILF